MDGISLQSSREGSNPKTQRVTLTPVNPGDGFDAVIRRPEPTSPRHGLPYLLSTLLT